MFNASTIINFLKKFGKSSVKAEPTVKQRQLKLGAWCGQTTLSNQKRDVDFAKDLGLQRLDIVVNDHSEYRSPMPFSIRNRGQITSLIQRVQDNGMEAHILSWIMPHQNYLVEASDVLLSLCNDYVVTSLVWDAEEPWTKAKKALPYDQAGLIVRTHFRELICPMATTGIGYFNAKKLRPLVAECEYVIPQAYSTSTSGQKPEIAPIQFHDSWVKAFDKPVVMGLASYKQSDIKGHTPTTAIRTALNKTSTLLKVNTAIYWSLDAIRLNKEVALAIKNWNTE